MEIVPDVWPVRALSREVGGTPGIVSSSAFPCPNSELLKYFFFPSLPSADVDFQWDFPGIVT